MEPLTPKSEINVAQDTDVTRVAHTEMCFSDFYDSRVFPTTPANPNIWQYTFQILPNNSELHPRSCDLVVAFKLTNADNSDIDPSTQVSCLQSLGVTAWQSANVKIGGTLYQPEFSFNEHAFHFRQMGCYTRRERDALFQQFGYREDTVSRTDCQEPSLDPNCLCKCPRCLCALKKVKICNIFAASMKFLTFDI